MSDDILGTSCDQCRSMVQYSFTVSTETRRLVRTDSPGRPPRLSQLLNYGTQRAWNAYYIDKNGKEAERQPIKTPISAMTVSLTNHSRRETWRPLAGSLQRYEKQAKVWSSAGEGGGGEDGDGLGDVGEGRGHGDQVRRVSRHLFLFFLVEWPLLVDRLGCLLGKHACLDGSDYAFLIERFMFPTTEGQRYGHAQFCRLVAHLVSFAHGPM